MDELDELLPASARRSFFGLLDELSFELVPLDEEEYCEVLELFEGDELELFEGDELELFEGDELLMDEELSVAEELLWG